MSERPNYAEECQVDRDCRNPRLPSEPLCAVHARALAAEIARDTYRQRAEEAEEVAGAITEVNVRLARELIAAERTVREQREALERIASDKCVVAKVSWSGTVTCEEMWEGDPDARCPVCIARTALAALAPNPDREGR